MRSHFNPNSCMALACAVSGATTMLTSAANAAQVAFDSPADPVYADGWQANDNGGFGFTGWSFYGTYTSATQHALDSTSPYNQLGLAWTLYLPNGNLPQQSPDSPNPPPPPGNPTDLSRAGRGIIGGLQIGQTISVVVDNPTERTFFKGYTISLISGTNNVGYCCAAGVQRLRVGTFEYFTYGGWYTPNGPGFFNTCGIFDTDTAAAGMRLDIKLTGVNSYSLTLTPLGNPSLAYTESGTMSQGTGLPINWIMFEHYNTDSDFYDAAGPHVATNPKATDFYIGGMEITTSDGGGGQPPLVSGRPAPNKGGKNPPSGKQNTANPDGFFQLLAEDDNDPNPQIFVVDSASSFVAGPFANGDIVKITSNTGGASNQKPMGGVAAHITLTGTALIYGTDSDGNASTPTPIP